MVRLKLKEYIDKAGITRYKLSQMTDIAYPTINRYYNNKSQKYDAYILDKICTALNCKIEDILEHVE